MLRALVPWSVAFLLVAASLAVGWAADRNVWSAAVLYAEPFLLVLAVWVVAGTWMVGARGWRVALPVALVLGELALRIPVSVSPATDDPPDWARAVQKCVNGLKPPAAGLRVLTWTLDDVSAPGSVFAAVEITKPDVVVLQGAEDPELVQGVVERVGGEPYFAPPQGEAEGLAVVARGGFHPCGDSQLWADATETPYGYTLAFVGVPPATVFPLLVARLPGPEAGLAWGRESAEARRRITSVLGALQAQSMVVVADARAPRGFRRLDHRLAVLGLSTVPVPASWPARIFGFQTPTLHPFDRVWVGDQWRVDAARRVPATEGARAPILTVLAPRTVGTTGE